MVHRDHIRSLVYVAEMASRSILDRDSFQKLLASAFAVQQSGIDPALLSAMVQVERMIRPGGLTLDEALQLVADQALNVGGAAGAAVAVLENDRLIYRAASGNAIDCAGQDVKVKSASDASGRTLILPFFHEHALAGLLEVRYNDPHIFQQREIHAYQFLASLAGDAIAQHAVPTAEPERDEKEPSPAEMAVQNKERIPEPGRERLGPPKATRKPQFVPAIAAAMAGLRSSANSLKGTFTEIQGKAWSVTMRASSALHAPIRLPRWSVNLTAAVLMLGAIYWVALGKDHAHPSARAVPARTVQASPAAMPAAGGTQSSPSPAKGALETQEVAHVEKPSPARISAFRRVRVSAHEVDEVADDVTVRNFVSAAPQRALRFHRNYRETDIGSDVTVRRFNSRGSSPGSIAASGDRAGDNVTSVRDR